MYVISIEDIRKVIDPLVFDDLFAELESNGRYMLETLVQIQSKEC